MDVIEAILNRKSIRYFEPYTIPEEEVKLLLECTRFAPSGGNGQPWEFVVVDDRDDISQIYDFGWTAYGGGSNICRFGDASLLVFFLGSAQCYLAAENLALAAYGLGYGCAGYLIHPSQYERGYRLSWLGPAMQGATNLLSHDWHEIR